MLSRADIPTKTTFVDLFSAVKASAGFVSFVFLVRNALLLRAFFTANNQNTSENHQPQSHNSYNPTDTHAIKNGPIGALMQC